MSQPESSTLQTQAPYDDCDDDDIRMNDLDSHPSNPKDRTGEKKKATKPTKTPQRSSKSDESVVVDTVSSATKKRTMPSSLIRFSDEQSRSKKGTSAYLAYRRAIDYMSGVKAGSLRKARLRSNHLNPKKTNPMKRPNRTTRQTRQFKENLGKVMTTGPVDLLIEAAASLYIQNLIKNGYYPTVGVAKGRATGTKVAKLRFWKQHKQAKKTNHNSMYDGSGKVNTSSSNVQHFISKTIGASHIGEAYVNGSNLFAQLSGDKMLSSYDLGIPFPTHTRSNLINNEKNKQKK
jgi:hypothetical protein